MTGNGRAAWSAALGVLSALTLPLAIGATRYSDSYDLLHAGFAVPVAVALGIAGLVLARQAADLDRATLGRSGGRTAARVGRISGIVGLCLAASATISLAIYGVLIAMD